VASKSTHVSGIGRHDPRFTNALVSTVPSDSAFSVGNRMLNSKRTRLQHTTLEMCMCFKDWLDAEFDKQRIDLYDESSKSEYNDSAGPSTTQ